ncbi:MAG: hypothetical protein A2Y76_03985 [Planctomycetes bacterium RBG_13_60_9]|nr:MAG: hypothetical protein A2Y76_03985 [Planctomycetes bacterium RBG_13_60_9]
MTCGFSQTEEHYFEGDAAQSGDIADSNDTWMQATVSGTGYISFYWKVSTDGGDYRVHDRSCDPGC